MKLTSIQQAELFSVIKDTIGNGLKGEKPGHPISDDSDLNRESATFVTLHINGQLRGCIGSLVAYRPLIEDVAHNAYSAAFRDPRFEPLTDREAEQLEIEFSILTPPKPMENCGSRQDLLNQLQPHEDGVIISQDYHRATFLPSVWSQLSDPDTFIDHLMRKAGIFEWSPNIRCERYSVVSFENTWKAI